MSEWINILIDHPKPEKNFFGLSNKYGYQVLMYSNNPFNSNGLKTLDDLVIEDGLHHWYRFDNDEQLPEPPKDSDE